jgi:hypothetical protein
MKVQVQQVILGNDPMEAGKKLEAVVSVQYAQGWHLRGTIPHQCLEVKATGHGVSHTVAQLIFVKEERRGS